MRRAGWTALFVLVALAGCRGGKTESYVPSESTARDALTTALSAWRDGKPHGHLDGTPAVEVYVTPWRDGQQLAAFEILGEDEVSGHHRFTVKLTMRKPAGTKEVKFLVIGKDRGPIWVYREDDYQKDTGM